MNRFQLPFKKKVGLNVLEISILNTRLFQLSVKNSAGETAAMPLSSSDIRVSVTV